MPGERKGGPPDMRLVVKSKESKQRYTLLAIWSHSDGKYRVLPEKGYKDRPGIAAIRLTDGTVYKADEVFWDIYEADGGKRDTGGDPGDGDEWGM
jgi:hypothetical protein